MSKVQGLSIESALMLLDDCDKVEPNRAVEMLKLLDSVVTSNLPQAKSESDSEAKNSSAAEQKQAAPLPKTPPITDAIISEAPEVFRRAAPPRENSAAAQPTDESQLLLSTSRLSSHGSQQKKQNETLIRALQELRTRMQKTRLKSGKIISSQP